MKSLSIKYLAIPLLSLTCFSAFANTEEEVKQVIVTNLEATVNEDLKELLETVHTKSQGFSDIKNVVSAVFDDYDIKNTLVSFDFIAEDEEYAYAKIIQRTEKVAGPEFKDHEIEILHILKKENGEWKFWSQAVLSSKLL